MNNYHHEYYRPTSRRDYGYVHNTIVVASRKPLDWMHLQFSGEDPVEDWSIDYEKPRAGSTTIPLGPLTRGELGLIACVHAARKYGWETP